jgi:hypothetical protein
MKTLDVSRTTNGQNPSAAPAGLGVCVGVREDRRGESFEHPARNRRKRALSLLWK